MWIDRGEFVHNPFSSSYHYVAFLSSCCFDAFCVALAGILVSGIMFEEDMVFFFLVVFWRFMGLVLLGISFLGLFWRGLLCCWGFVVFGVLVGGVGSFVSVWV